MEYLVLGPLRVTRAGEELALGGPQQRLVLALLIAADGQTVPLASLIDGVWGEDEPATAKKTIQGYVHHLRVQVGDALKTAGNGYSLATNGAVDAVEFEHLREAGLAAIAADPATAASRFHEALALWNGPPYADLDGHLSLAPEISRLANLRITVLGDRIDADLACGGHNGLVGELEGLTQEYPLQDRFRAQHMLALYRAGRQVEALRSFERTRRFLAEEMGLEPSQELRDLEQKILAADTSLEFESESEPSGRTAIRGYELREAVRTGDSVETYRAYQRSVGREVSVHVLGPGVADDPEFIANFVTDTQQVAALEHPNIGFVYDTWREPGRAYQVGRWFAGGSLADRMATEKISGATALRILDQVGNALAYAHRRKVSHGQVNASTVMFDDQGIAYLCDFVVGRDAASDSDREDFATLAHILLTGSNPRIIDGHLTPTVPITDVPEAVATVFAVAFEPGGGYAKVEDLLRALHQAMGTEAVAPDTEDARSRSDVRNPYKGLRAFQEADADDFFGRDDLVERLVAQVDSNRLVAVVGPSGSGKSSAVKAGLSARIRNRSGGPIRLQTEMFPGAFPFEELEGALLRIGVNRESLIDDLLSDERGLLRVLKQIMPADDAELLLIIDQFEELFSMATDRKVTQLFLDSLLTAASDPRSRLRIVVTMRADFYDRPLQHPEFGALFEAGLVSVTLPDQVGLAAAVAQPAISVGLDFEPGLVARIVSDLDDQPGGLPLLQYAMTELVNQRTSDVLTFSAYEAIGGVYGALGNRAEELYLALPPAGQRSTRHAFLRMVTVDEQAKDLRRRVTRAELAATDIDEQGLNEALQLFGSHRLLTFDRDPTTRARTVEVAHEALTREWDRLVEWITDERDDLVVRRRLDEALAEWDDSGQDASFLPSGSRLTQFQDWSNETNLMVSAREREFLDAGVARDLEAKKRKASRRRNSLIGLTALAAVMTVLALFAFLQKRSADELAFEAESDRLGADAIIVSEANPQLGLLMAAEAFARGESPSTLGALQRSMLETPFEGFIDRDALHVEWKGDRIFVLTGEGLEVMDDETYEVLQSFELDLAPSRHVGELPANADGILIPFIASDDGRFVGTALAGDSFVLIDVDQRGATTLDLHSPVSAAAISADGSMLALGFEDGTTEVRQLPDMTEVGQVSALSTPASHGAFTGLGARRISDYEAFFPGYERLGFQVGSVAFGPEGDRLAIGQSGQVVVVSTETFARTMPAVSIRSPDVFIFVSELGAALPLPIQQLWFDDDQTLMAKMLNSLFIIDTSRARVDREFALETQDPAGEIFTSESAAIVRPIGSGLALAARPNGLLQVIALTGNDPGEAAPATEIHTFAELGETLAVSPDGERFVAGHDQGLVLGRLVTQRPLVQVAARRVAGRSGTESAPGQPLDGGSALLSVGAERTIAASTSEAAVLTRATRDRYETSSGELLGNARFAESEGDDTDLLVLSAGGRGKIFGGTDLSFITAVPRMGHTFGVSPDGGLIAFGACVAPDDVCEQEDIDIFDIDAERVVDRLRSIGDARTIEWHPDGELLVAVDAAGEVFVWTTEDWKASANPVLQAKSAVAVRFSPDGTLFARVDATGLVEVVDLATGDVLVEVGADAGRARFSHSEHPWFSNDNSLLLTAHDRAVRLWDLATGEQIGAPFPNDVNVAAGGRSGEVLELVTAVDDSLLIWNLDTSTWFDTACETAGRNMTLAEWEQFGPRDTDYRATCPQYEALN